MIYRFVTIVYFLLAFSLQSNAQYQCDNADKTGLVSEAFHSFEKDIFAHYKFDNDTIKTYRTFLAEVASLSVDLKNLPSSSSIQMARKFKEKADDKNSIWIRLNDYENQEAAKNSILDTTQSNEEEILIFNYRGAFIQCLKNNSNSDDFKEIIYNLENDGNISTSVIAQKLYYLLDKEFNTPQVKKFAAFDIYYSILMVIEKAFK